MPDSGRGVRINAKADVVTLVRANVIGHIAREFLAAAGARPAELNRALRGFQKQILQQVEMVFEDTSSNDIGYLSIQVDWNKYKVNLTDNSKRVSFDLDPARPVTTQLSSLLENVASYLSQMVTQMHVTEMRCAYTARPGHQEEMYRELNIHKFSEGGLAKLRAARAKSRDMISGSSPEATSGLYIVDEDFSELGISIVNFKP
jgi:hypothetical protein